MKSAALALRNPFYTQSVRLFDTIFGFMFVLIGGIVMFTVSNSGPVDDDRRHDHRADPGHHRLGMVAGVPGGAARGGGCVEACVGADPWGRRR